MTHEMTRLRIHRPQARSDPDGSDASAAFGHASPGRRATTGGYFLNPQLQALNS